MKKNHTFTFITLFLIVLGLSACSSRTKDDSFNITFSEYYQNADDYEKIYPLLHQDEACRKHSGRRSSYGTDDL